MKDLCRQILARTRLAKDEDRWKALRAGCPFGEASDRVTERDDARAFAHDRVYRGYGGRGRRGARRRRRRAPRLSCDRGSDHRRGTTDQELPPSHHR
jgi:hypothetical protein